LATEFNARNLLIEGAPRRKTVVDNLRRVSDAATELAAALSALDDYSRKRRRQEYANRFAKQDLSPSPGQRCHSSGDNIGTQTCPNNNIPLTYQRRPSNRQQNGEGLGNGSAISSARAQNFVFLHPKSSKEVAKISAERRWNKELLDRFRHTSVYAAIVEALDLDLQEGATQAEVQRVGAGLKYILQELIGRSVLSGFEI
jgi:hypothetical protein